MINNSNFRKKLSTVKPVATSTCSKALNSLGVDANMETEARFGRMDRGRFVPGVNKRQFDAVRAHFDGLGWKKTATVDKVVSRTLNPRQTVRMVQSSNKTIYEFKEKISIVDVNSNYRLAKSKERRGEAYMDLFDQANKKGEYRVTRNRTTYTNDNIQIDLTLVDDKYQVEVEFKGPKNACKYIQLVSKIIEDTFVVGVVYNQYRQLMGQRFAGPLPQTLTLDAFKKRVLIKQAYSVTEKADGERFLLFIDQVGGFNLVSRGMNVTRMDDVESKPDFAGTVMDGELYKGKFYTFDILMVQGKDVRTQKLTDRLTVLFNVLTTLKIRSLKMKNFLVDTGKEIIEYPSGTSTGLKNIYEAAGKVWSRRKNFPYPLDGLIFTPVNEEYFSKNIFKWKDENTIDFYYKGTKLHLAGFDGSGKDYMVLPFEGMDGKGTFRTKTKSVVNAIFVDKEVPENVRKGLIATAIPGPPGVGEFKFEDNKFKLIRKRPDKEFPNGVEASNQSWEAISKPLTAEMISVGPGAMRDFHSEIKSKLIMKYAKGKSVLDIGSGKGEDIGKYVKAESKPVVGFDMVQEEYPHPDYMKFFKVNNPVYVVKDYVNKGQKFDVVNINFAIHYFLKNKELFESLVMNIHQNLKKGGVLMATVLDGRLVYQALKGKNTYNTNKVTFDKKYKNTQNFDSPKFKLLGQEVQVLVKGTKYFNKPISEFLFNFEKFLKIMEELGFELVEKGNFKEFCAESEWCLKYMTEAEKDYSFKNIYFVLRKK